MPKSVSQKQKCLSQVAYEQIKTMILQKDLTPGQFINEAQLQELLGGCAGLGAGPSGDDTSPQGY